LRAGGSTPIEAEPSKGSPAAAPTTAAANQAPVVEEELAVIRQVVLAVEPLDAKVFAGGQDLGKIPVFVDVEDGKTVSVEVKRDGYLSQTLALDGSEGRLSIKLEKEKAATKAHQRLPKAPAPKAKPKAPNKKKKPSLGGGEIINPWG